MDFIYLAQAVPGAAPGAAPAMDYTSMLTPILLTVVIFYFFLIRPDSKRRKDLENQVSALRKYDRVLTSGGIVGTVWAVKEKEIVLQVDDNAKTRIHFVKSAIVSVLERSDKGEKGDKGEKEAETPVGATAEGDKGKGSSTPA